jgi:hypothetical protein
MVSSSQIRGKLADYLSHRVDLDSFEDWLVQETWNIHQWGSRSAEVLTFAIEEALSEYSSDHISTRRLREELSYILYAENKSASFVNAPREVSFEVFPVSQAVRVAYAQP